MILRLDRCGCGPEGVRLGASRVGRTCISPTVLAWPMLMGTSGAAGRARDAQRDGMRWHGSRARPRVLRTVGRSTTLDRYASVRHHPRIGPEDVSDHLATRLDSVERRRRA